jgi:hypothetical protein
VSAVPNLNVPVEIDGFLYDSETGELLGAALPQPAFVVDSEEAASWVLGKILDAEAAVAAIDSTPDVIRARAVLENAERIRKERAARLDWLKRRFEPELGAFARKQLDGKKTKTWKTVLGSVSLKTKNGGVRMTDEARALAWAKMHAPEAVKTTERFLISELPDEALTTIVRALNGPATPDEEPLRAAFELVQDDETVHIKTGVTTK